MQTMAQESRFRQKLGSIFSGLGSSRAAPLPQKSYEELEHNTFFTADVIRELERGVPTAQRVRAMKELHEIVATKRLEEVANLIAAHAIQVIWQAIKDMTEPSQPEDVRQAALVFTRALISGQFQDLGIMRAHFFHVVQRHTVKEDTQHRLEILRVLTADGKNIQYMEEVIGPFLVQWMPEVVTLGRAVDFLSLLVNFIHYNAAYLDEGVLIGLVQISCVLAKKSTAQPEIIQLSLDFLNGVVCYSSLPPDALQSFVTTLCHTLNIERFSKRSLEVMLKLLGTHLGRSAIYTMCTLIQERSTRGQDALLLRGAVFYISMSMWGINRVETLGLSFASVLPSLKQAVLSGHTIVVYEVALSLSRLVKKHSSHLHPLEWELLYDLLEAILGHMKHLHQATGEHVGLSSGNQLVSCVRELFLSIEELYEGGVVIGTPEKFFGLLEQSLDTLPVHSVLTLMTYRKRVISSAVHEQDWVRQVADFMHKFYRKEIRTDIRKEALIFLRTILSENSISHESSLMEYVLLPVLGTVGDDPDSDIRCSAVQLLVHCLSEASPQWGKQIVNIISSVLNKGLEMAVARGDESTEDPLKLPESKAAVFGLTQLFKTKLHSSSPLPGLIFDLLLDLVLQQYEQKCCLPPACVMRMNIFNCILTLRSNEAGRVGYIENGFSPFFMCCLPPASEVDSVISPTLLDYKLAFDAVLECLRHECEWEVLMEVLHHLRGLLEDRTITLAGMPDLSMLAIELCQMVEEHSPCLSRLQNVSSSWSKSDLSSYVHPVLANLCTYPSHLDRKAQLSLVCCLEAGLVGKSAQLCISALSLCSLELQATMTRLLPRVLYRLGQVAATPTMALPVLEFLAGLIPVPALYRGFVEREYLGVFAIALPYTRPEKYSCYVNALAHHVIATWFVQCRMQYRPSIARFIHKSLSMDLCVGPRQSSPQGKGGEGEGVGVVPELTEVCLDMMARYTYSNLSSLPSRSPGADFLISGGPSKTWLVGHTLVTVTTSGQGGGMPGTCKKCESRRRMGQPPPMDYIPEVESEGVLPNEVAPDGDGGTTKGPIICSCWCRGWSEIKICRPTGNISWLMRNQNRLQPLYTLSDIDHSLLTANYPFEEMESGVYAIPKRLEEGGEGEEGEEWEELAVDGGEKPQEVEVNVNEEQLQLSSNTKQGEDLKQKSEPLDDVAQQTGITSEQKSEPLEHPLDDVAQQTGITSDSDEVTPQPSTTPSRSTSVPSSPSKPTSQSWSEAGGVEHPFLVPQPSSFQTLLSLEHLPPLLSYDEGDGLGRSPSLHGSGGLLSEQEQLSLLASVSEQSSSSATESTDGTATPILSEDVDGGGSVDGGEWSALPQDVPEGGEKQPEATVQVEQTKDSLWPQLKHQNLSLLEEAPDQPLHLPPSRPTENGSPVLRRKSVPLSHTSTPHTPTTSPAIGRKKLVFTPITNVSSPAIDQGVSEESEVYNNPSFIFLQLYHSSSLGDHTPFTGTSTPILLPNVESVQRALKMLDLIPPYDTHKIGIVYVDKNQTQEQDILSNTFGSSRYVEFLRGLGQLLWLADCPPGVVYLGGLDRSGTDGKFAYFYQDDITQVIFHIATLMPTHTSDPHCSNKKLHIGNDFVTIVYNDSQLPYSFGTIRGQFNFVEVVIEPLSGSMNRVSIRTKKGLEDMLHGDPCLISDAWLPVLVRQKALQANLASLVHMSETVTEHYPSNWLGRLKQIQRIKEKCLAEGTQGLRVTKRTPPITDFTTFS